MRVSRHQPLVMAAGSDVADTGPYLITSELAHAMRGVSEILASGDVSSAIFEKLHNILTLIWRRELKKSRSAVLSNYNKEGLISFEGRKIIVQDLNKLKEISKNG